MDFRQRVALFDPISAFRAADDTDSVIDRVVLGRTTRAEVESRDANGRRRDPLDVTAPRGGHGSDDRCNREFSKLGSPP